MSRLFSAAPPANRNLAGILFLLAGIAVFSLQDVVLKQISGTYPLSEAMTIRSLVAAPLMLLIMRQADGGLHTLLTPRWHLMFLRGLLNFTAYTCFYLGLSVLPMATTVALFFAAPLFISLLAPVLLGERVVPAALLAVLAGFAGLLLIVRPGVGGLGAAAALPILGALGYALTMLAARPLGRSESAAAMAFWANASFLLAALGLSAAFGDGSWLARSPEALRFLMLPWVWPSLHGLVAMAACGVIAAAGLTLLTAAYSAAPSAVVAPFEYSYLFWGLLWGWVFWGDLPGALAWPGIAMIVAAGLVVVRQEARPA